MAESALSLAVNGREHQLERKLVLFRAPVTPEPGPGPSNGHAGPGRRPAQALLPGGLDGAATWSAAIVGLGYVGLPTAAALQGQCGPVTGIDVNPERLRQIEAREADLAGPDRARVEAALDDGSLELTCDPAAAARADAVIICVPTPVSGDHVPDLRALRGACESVVAHARPGQTVILTSTTYVGTTRELLAGPLQRRGLRVGSDVFVAFSPERIDPGNPDHVQRKTPRVVGGVTQECARRAATVIGHLTDVVYLVSSPDAAEATKLYENIFRAVSLALANEFADACGTLSLDPVEVTLAAGTKPYGFLGALPGPGVGGHCIPCDPHYLLWQLGRDGHRSPLIEQAMTSIRLRPGRVAERARQVLAAGGRTPADARVIVVGVSYKAGVQDLRESSALPERFSDATIVVSQTVRDRMVAWGVRPSRITVIPNGVDLGRIAFDAAARARVRDQFGIADSEYVIGVLGRLDPNKQFGLVIEAAAALLGDGARLLVVGKGEEDARLRQVAAGCGVADRVVFAGERHDVAAMLSAMDLFVASSAQETFGLSVLEALGNGAPVLYTTCPALRGLDVSRARQVPATVPALREAMAAEAQAGPRDRLPEPAVEKTYGIQAVTNRIDDLYEQLAARRSWRTRLRRGE